ncbi:MAG TPA: carboxylating nicotinate-nucleotide diphosphorylase [Gemmatimonadaceae bacterium]|nr:carboxylating nicotinate-nucleotide diphosphorylase [Gemmatimonadaceae bacterium]
MENPTPMPESQPPRRSVPRTVTPLSVPAIDAAGTLRFPLKQQALDALVRGSLEEDGAFDDLTTIATVVSERRARAALVARENGVVCGVALALNSFRLLDPKVAIRIDVEDGMRVSSGASVLFVNGNARALLSAERVALNFLQRLSGIASLTAEFVAMVAGTGAKILDTRKTTPGWRQLEKYAVRAGGGYNHRMNLSSAVLIKDNHLAALDGDIAKAVQRARELAPDVKIEVECDNLEQVERAVAASADIIMLDNMTLDEMRSAVRHVRKRSILEASGGVNLSTVRDIAETGVDWISVGALTHSAPAMDLGLDFD